MAFDGLTIFVNGRDRSLTTPSPTTLSSFWFAFISSRSGLPFALFASVPASSS